MEPFLGNNLNPIPQFILVSVNFLITTTQAQYLNRLSDKIRDKINPIIASGSVKAQWWFLLTGWWLLTLSSILVVIRIVLFAFSLMSGPFDLSIIVIMGLGYLSLMTVAAIAWRRPPW